MKELRPLLGPVTVVVLVAAAVLWSPFAPHGDPVVEEPFGPTMSTEEWDDVDYAIFYQQISLAVHRGFDTLAIGDAMVALGTLFLGTAYEPHTLEVEGPERLVINFRGLDCVTFVENVHSMARFLKSGAADLLGDRHAAETRYEELLTELRYRDGRIDGYPSRLHYFSDWIADNARKGLLTDITGDLGGELDTSPIDFMSTHPDAYRQLADESFVARVRDAERRLSAQGRRFVPEDRIADVADRIRDGDVIAATSTVEGLDVAHTGLATWVEGELHLLHAPLVGSTVVLSPVSLAERILRIEGQDGIIVARPSEPGS